MDYFVTTKGGICTSDRGPKAQSLQLTRLSKRIKSLENVESFFELVQELWKKCKFPDTQEEPDRIKSKRPPKDPNAPKRARNAFMFMCDDRRESLKRGRPDLTGVDITRELGRMWREDITPEDREPYETLAAFDKDRYEAELTTFQETGCSAPTVAPRKLRSKRISATIIPEPGESSVPIQTSSLTIPRLRARDAPQEVIQPEATALDRMDSQETIVAEAAYSLDSQETIVAEDDEATQPLDLDSQETIVAEDDEATQPLDLDSQETIVAEDDVATQPLDCPETLGASSSSATQPRASLGTDLEEDSIVVSDDELVEEDPDPEGSPSPFRQRLIEFLTLVNGPVSEADSILSKYSSGEEMFEALEAQYGSAYEKAIASPAKELPLEDLLEEVAPRKVRKLPAFITERQKNPTPAVSKTFLRKAEAAYRKQIGTQLKAEDSSLDRTTLNTVLREGWVKLSEEEQLAFLD